MRAFRALVGLAVALLSACASSPPPRTDVQAKDNGVGLPLLRVRKDIGESVALRAGYAHTRFEFDQDTASIVDVRASGPMLGLELRF